MPVTARQVLTCPEEGLKIGSLDVYLVCCKFESSLFLYCI